jgi:uncharacterized tellurite resistance protein B-like protein
MAEALTFSDDLAAKYIGALIAIARTDGDIGFDESAKLREIAARRTPVPVDDELLFFGAVTPDGLRAAAAGRVARDVGCALVGDAIELSTADGDLNGAEATAIVRFARALGCSDDDIRTQTPELDEWLPRLAP